MSYSRIVSSVPRRYAAPIHALPREILSYVFELVTFALSPDESASIGDSLQKLPFHPTSITAPTTLCAVNRQWRYVCLTTSKLWSSIFVSIDHIIDCDYGGGGHPGPPGSTRILDLGSLACFLSRSRNSPIDILIDGRDPEWGSPDLDLAKGCSVYDHPFRPEFMTQVLDILFHHVSRWRSLVILTDTWAPMHAAIYRLSISPFRRESFHNISGGASCLETLTLMHCSEYIAHSDVFFPGELREPISTPFAALLSHPYDSLSAVRRSLPRLQCVSLLGVHVNWVDFSTFVSATCGGGLSGGIQILQLSYHCYDVRPSVEDFRKVLEGCPDLRSLTLKLSGPQDVEEVSEEHSVALPSLERLHLEYDRVQSAIRTLSLIRCPNLKSLVVEDVAHGDRAQYNGSQLLVYCATGSLSTPFVHSDDLVSSSASTSPTLTDATAQKPPFPLLEDLAMHRITACMMPYATLFASLANLRRLTHPSHSYACDCLASASTLLL
ncbi:hypothetical protein BU15DRAFT_47863 [Melanogaster broomeanus]|nr:hypothetical protein BU15DRAFT_47863 [Melanogaster broomeanus]